MEPFGPQTYIIRSVPSALPLEEAEELIRDPLGEIKREGSAAEKGSALHTMACKSAVRFGDPLTHDEMRAIIRGWNPSPDAMCVPTDDQVYSLWRIRHCSGCSSAWGFNRKSQQNLQFTSGIHLQLGVYHSAYIWTTGMENSNFIIRKERVSVYLQEWKVSQHE